MGETFGVFARFGIFDECFELKYILNEVHDLVETHLEGSHDVFVHEDSPSLGYTIVLPNPLDHSHASPM